MYAFAIGVHWNSRWDKTGGTPMAKEYIHCYLIFRAPIPGSFFYAS